VGMQRESERPDAQTLAPGARLACVRGVVWCGGAGRREGGPRGDVGARRERGGQRTRGHAAASGERAVRTSLSTGAGARLCVCS